MALYKKKRFWGSVAGRIILFLSLLFLWPQSLLKNTESDIQSISIVVIEESFEHNNSTYVYNIDDPMFDAIMDILDQYSYHASLNTISKRLEKRVELEGNLAGHWLHIYLYTAPDRYGECYQIISGGTGEVIVDDGVYRMGYWGNKTARKFMDEVYQVVNP